MARLSELERAAFLTVAGEDVMAVAEVTGTEGPAPNVRLSELQRGAFTTIDGQVAVRTMNFGGGSGDGSCTLETSVQTQSFGWDDTSSNSRNFNVDNTGFEWNLGLGETSIIALCENVLVTPLPTTTGGMGDLTVSSITLNGTDILADIVETPGTNTLKIEYPIQIINPNLTGNNTFEVKLNLLLGETVVPELTQTLTYNAPAFNLSISTSNLNFNNTYNTATVNRTFSRGNPTAFVSTVLGGTALTAGANNLTFTPLDINSSQAERTLVDTVTFTNVTDSSTLNVARSAILNPTFQFPIYLGSVDTTVGLDTNTVNTFTQVLTTATSRPGSQNFSWPNETGAIKVFGIANNFFSGQINFKANSSSVIGNLQDSFAQIDTGSEATRTASYNYYEAQDGQPGAVTLFVEFV